MFVKQTVVNLGYCKVHNTTSKEYKTNEFLSQEEERYRTTSSSTPSSSKQGFCGLSRSTELFLLCKMSSNQRIAKLKSRAKDSTTQFGGGGEIRTLEIREDLSVFKTDGINRYPTPPGSANYTLVRGSFYSNN